MQNLIIRKSKFNNYLYLIKNAENVFRVVCRNEEKFNSLNYDEASEYFNKLNLF